MQESKRLTLLIHPPMEYLYSLFALGTESHYYNMITDFNLEPKEELLNTVQTMRDGLSNYMEQELRFFFDLSGLGYIFYQYILENSEILDINQLISVLQNEDPTTFVFRMIRSVCKNSLPPVTDSEYQELQKDISRMRALLERSELQDNTRRVRLLDYLKHPGETKQRFCFFLTQFYQSCYSVIEDRILTITAKEKEKFEGLLRKNPDKFTEQYLSIDPQAAEMPTVILSFFKYISWHHYSVSAPGRSGDWYVLGLYSDLLYDEGLLQERYANFFKTLSDPNRIAILKLLSQKPWYGQELAERLKLTPATISYHMTFLQRVGVITYERIDNRSYYCLNSQKMIKLLEEFRQFVVE